MNWAVMACSIPFLLAGLSQMNEWVRTHLPWLPPILSLGGIEGILVGVYWNSWCSIWFGFLLP